MESFTYYQAYLNTGIDASESYLLSDDLFRPLHITAPYGVPAYPPLTISGILLNLTFARAAAQTIREQTELDQIQRDLDHIRVHWRVAWEKKASWEFSSRLRQWNDRVKEIRIDPQDNADYYPYEVRLRVQLELLLLERITPESALLENLSGLDQLLRVLLKPSHFLWEQELVTFFPQDQFWYLYGLPAEL